MNHTHEIIIRVNRHQILDEIVKCIPYLPDCFRYPYSLRGICHLARVKRNDTHTFGCIDDGIISALCGINS